MTLKRQLRDAWVAGRWTAALAAALGAVVVLISETPLERWSFDLPYLARPVENITNLVIVYMDDVSHAVLNQPYDNSWDRFVAAQLVQSLTRCGAKAIAFDVLFDTPGPDAAASRALADAIRAHGRVVLGADLGSGDYYGLASEVRVILPHTNFLAATPNWGLVQLDPGSDDAVRKHFHGGEEIPSLSWKLAALLGAGATTGSNGQRQERWLNYYGPRDTLTHISYHKALESSEPAVRESFRGQVVFVGSRTQSGFSGKRRDQFHTPYSGWSEPLWPGVDLHATQFLNLMRGDWLRRLPGTAEVALLVLSGVIAGLGLANLRPLVATFTGLTAALLVFVAACLLVWLTHTWFSWMIISALQIPLALAGSILCRAEHASALRPTDLTTEFAPAGSGGPPVIPDYEMLLRIGSGSYGEVWLARSATGTFRAVKIVDRKSAQDVRFEREFAGLKKFEPISRSHEGLVHVLHVGRNEALGQLYYVMELADSCAADPNKDPHGYVPMTLRTKLQPGGVLDPGDLPRISLGLASALAFLHYQGLIHRDIKPSNIIFVAGQPKLADIGLVTSTDETRSFVGTEGFIPPEGPGTMAADVFSLGKVLNELLTVTCQRSTSAGEEAEQLQQVIQQACARDLGRRPRNGTELLELIRSTLDRAQ